MIHFKQQLKDEALELIKVKDNVDLFKDIIDISNQISVLEKHPYDEAVFLYANDLDEKMRKEYPVIKELLSIGNLFATNLYNSTQQPITKSESLKSNLKQDMYGILCHALIKGNVIQKVEQFIERVD